MMLPESCMDAAQMVDFISRLDVAVTKMTGGLGLIIHATAGDAYWFWDGALFCIGHGVPL